MSHFALHAVWLWVLSHIGSFLGCLCMSRHFSACMHVLLFARAGECGLGLVSGSHQHMPDTALWGPAFIPRCFHSPTFAIGAQKMFSQVFAFQQKRKKKKKRQHLLLHTPGLWPFIWYPTFFNYAARPQKNMLHFFPCTNSFWHTGQANKLTVKLY